MRVFLSRLRFRLFPPTDPRTGRRFGDHGKGHQAIQWALEHLDDPNDFRCFLDDWLAGDTAEWPEFYGWLNGQPS